MVDLHCHILPGIDDGAKTTDISLEMLRLQKEQGVKKIAFTPHLKLDETTYEDFLKSREGSRKTLFSLPEYKEITDGLEIKTGAEVYFSLGILNYDLEPLCYEGTDYILIELPVKAKPYGLAEGLSNIINMGYTPVIAHVERYPYFADNPVLLYDLVMDGCIAHINAETVIKNNTASKMAMKYIKWGLVHFICSDCHSTKHRVPNLMNAYTVLKKEFGGQYVDWLVKNSENVFDNRYVDLNIVQKPKKFLGFWK